jgi:hypothetical protein
MLDIHPLYFIDLEAADQVLMSAYQAASRKVELERWMHLERTTWLAGQEGDLLESAGFTRQRTLRHMQRGSSRSARSLAHIYGQGSFMLG